MTVTTNNASYYSERKICSAIKVSKCYEHYCKLRSAYIKEVGKYRQLHPMKIAPRKTTSRINCLLLSQT